MRLLEIKSPGKFNLVQVAPHETPPYAILSHTWTDGQEVTYQDLTSGAVIRKTGYEKIKFCGNQATKDGLRYFWVDTCCIDKSNQDELATAISSMFRWYQNAKKCYVYLVDVTTPGHDMDVQIRQSIWEAAFRDSRWFTRGWTLQELIAPAIVEFFSRDSKQLGSKASLEGLIHEITKIPIQALRGNPFSDFSIAERVDWARGRQTKEEEDMVYCLLGLCEVSMPSIYGEGKEAALERLRMKVRGSKNSGERSDQEGGVRYNETFLQQPIEGHSSLVRAIAFSPDGMRVASASDDLTVKLWDFRTGAVLVTLNGHSSTVRAIAFSPDGTRVASASDDVTVKLWDVMIGTALWTLDDHLSSITTVSFSPDGNLVASASNDQTVKLWNVTTGALLQTLGGHLDSIRAIAFSPDCMRLASVSDDLTSKLWDVMTGAMLATLVGHSSPPTAVAFSPDGRVVASASHDQTVTLSDTSTGQILQTLRGHLDWIRAIAFSSDGRFIASGSDDLTVKFWDLMTGAILQTFEGHSSSIKAVALYNGLLLSASDNLMVKVWDTK